MAHAYTPGPKVTADTLVRKQRRLPLSGQTMASQGDRVAGEQVVARTELPGNVTTLNVGGLLGVPPDDVPGLMLKQAGDKVKKNEVVAQSKGLFGLFKSAVRSPVEGSLESVSNVTGQVILREPPIPVQVAAYIDGTVTEVIPNEGVVVESRASLVQGIFGVGGEIRGEIKVVAPGPDAVIDKQDLDESCAGKVLIAGSLLTAEVVERAIAVKAKAIVVGGIEDATLRSFLGYDIGVAITGSEQRGLTIVVTEGFGAMRMAQPTFDLLRSLEGRMASVNGATQIRAGVIRPEVIVPREQTAGVITSSKAEGGLEVGMAVRIIRNPDFGKIGRVQALPSELQQVESEARCRVLEVELEDGKRVTMPRANVEIIEG